MAEIGAHVKGAAASPAQTVHRQGVPRFVGAETGAESLDGVT
jgi:hypothetical protein